MGRKRNTGRNRKKQANHNRRNKTRSSDPLQPLRVRQGNFQEHPAIGSLIAEIMIAAEGVSPDYAGILTKLRKLTTEVDSFLTTLRPGKQYRQCLELQKFIKSAERHYTSHTKGSSNTPPQVEGEGGCEIETVAGPMRVSRTVFELMLRMEQERSHGNYEQALAFCKQAQKLLPEIPDIYVNQGQIEMQLELYSEAIANFTMAAQRAGEDTRRSFSLNCTKAYIIKAEMHRTREEFAEAIATCDEGLASCWPDANEHRVVLLRIVISCHKRLAELAGASQQQIHYQAIVKAGEELVAISGAINDLEELGRTYFKLGDDSSAIRCYSAILQQDPNHSAALQLRANTYSHLEEWELLDRDSARVLATDPTNGHLHFIIGFAKFYLGKYEEAMFHLEQCGERNLEQEDYYVLGLHIECCIKTRKFEAMETSLAKLERLYPQNPITLGLLSEAITEAMQANLPIKALAYATRALELEPDEISFSTLRGNIYYRQRQIPAAIADVNRTLSLIDSDTDFNYFCFIKACLGYLHLENGDLELAQTICDELLAIGELDDELKCKVLAVQADIAATQKNWKKESRTLRELISLSPQGIVTYLKFRLAITYAHRNNFSVGVDIIRTMLPTLTEREQEDLELTQDPIMQHLVQAAKSRTETAAVQENAQLTAPENSSTQKPDCYIIYHRDLIENFKIVASIDPKLARKHPEIFAKGIAVLAQGANMCRARQPGIAPAGAGRYKLKPGGTGARFFGTGQRVVNSETQQHEIRVNFDCINPKHQ